MKTRHTIPLLVCLSVAGNACGSNEDIPPPPPDVVMQESITIPSAAEPANSPGSGGTTAAAYPALVTQYGTESVNLNRASYTRYFDATLADQQPDAILILVPGFEGGSASFTILAENLIERVRRSGFALEVWGFDRRGEQLEDRAGLLLAAETADAQMALDWYFGSELGLTLHPALAAGPNRRAIFHDAQAGTAFIANWTPLVFSRDIDAVVEAARATAKNANVFLGGHSAGTGFAARYAATDFNFSGSGGAQPGFTKLRGLVLLEGGGGSTGEELSDDALDRIEDRADGGLFAAVRDNAPRCVDGSPCTVTTEAADCAGKGHAKCTPPTFAYSIVPNLLNPRILALGEVVAVQAMTDPDGGQVISQVDQGAPGNNATAKVADLSILSNVIPPSTAEGSFGTFVDDDGAVSSFATFVRTSVGAPGPQVDGLATWLDITEPLPDDVLPNNGPPPSLPNVWGQEREVTRIERFLSSFRTGERNFTDWYFPASGLSTTSAPGSCNNGRCTTGDVDSSCEDDGDCTQSVGLDSTALSIERGRHDIENLTQARAIDIPVICFGGSNGLTPTPSSYLSFARSIATCSAPSCTGVPRVIDPSSPSETFPTYGNVQGGFEVHITEGIAHIDIVTAEDDDDNRVIGPLIDFVTRNAR